MWQVEADGLCKQHEWHPLVVSVMTDFIVRQYWTDTRMWYRLMLQKRLVQVSNLIREREIMTARNLIASGTSITTVNVVVKKQKVFMTCSGIVGAPPVIHLMCSPIYWLQLKVWLVNCFQLMEVAAWSIKLMCHDMQLNMIILTTGNRHQQLQVQCNLSRIMIDPKVINLVVVIGLLLQVAVC